MFFFFSSRRRHTRYWRDWSSDVCSSDLIESGHDGVLRWGLRGYFARWMRGKRQRTANVVGPLGGGGRSEERRVGKECRSRGSAYHEKRKKIVRNVRR